jgi:hypothetical protein
MRYRLRRSPSGEVSKAGAGAKTARAAREALARRWICEQYPRLRESAERFGWAMALNAEIEILRSGGDATRSLRNLRIEPHEERGNDPIAIASWGEHVPVGQRFHCPYGACPDIGRNLDGSEPRCHIAGTIRPSTTESPAR